MYAAYKAAVEHKGQPTVILAKTVKGYGLGEAGEGKKHFAPAKEAERKGTARVPRAVQGSHQRRGHRRNAVLPPACRQPGDRNICWSGARRSADFCRSARRHAGPLDVPKLEYFRRILQRLRARLKSRPRWRSSGCSACCSRNKAIGRHDRADHSRRGAHVRPGRAVPRDRHLFVQRPALRAGGQQVAALLSRSQGRADSRGRHHRSGRDVVVHRGRHELRHHGRT